MPHDQRETPYLDAALRYKATGYTPFHTPGHKLGKGAPAGLREFVGDTCLSADLAMAGAVEDTRESTGLIRLAESYAAEAWGSDRAWFLVNGSSSGVHALLLTLCGPGDTVIVPRNAHKSLLAGLIFTGATPLYMEPAIDRLWGIPMQVRVADARRALERALVAEHGAPGPGDDDVRLPLLTVPMPAERARVGLVAEVVTPMSREPCCECAKLPVEIPLPSTAAPDWAGKSARLVRRGSGGAANSR